MSTKRLRAHRHECAVCGRRYPCSKAHTILDGGRFGLHPRCAGEVFPLLPEGRPIRISLRPASRWERRKRRRSSRCPGSAARHLKSAGSASSATSPEVRVLRAFETAKEMAGITRRFRFHDLRHTFASTLASQGVSLQVIAKALGHTTTRMSERYARPSEEAIRKAAEALDRANQSSAVNCSRELVTINGVTSAAAGVAFSQRANEMAGGRCRDRTGDLLRVKQTLCR
jgi:hypothetical protein